MVIATLPEPPANADEGGCYRIAAPAQGDWAGHEDAIAIRIAGSWHVVPPVEGTTLFDQAAGRLIVYRSGWREALTPVLPVSGTVVDTEARAALAQVGAGLQSLGLLAPPKG